MYVDANCVLCSDTDINSQRKKTKFTNNYFTEMAILYLYI